MKDLSFLDGDKIALCSQYIPFELQRKWGAVLINFRDHKVLESEKLILLCFKTYIMIHQLDIVVPVIVNDSKSFLDELCQFTPLNMPKIHVGTLLDRESVKTRSLWSMKTWHMREPLEFGYAIASNWSTKELQGVWQLETQTSVSLWAWKCLRYAVSPNQRILESIFVKVEIQVGNMGKA